MYRLDVLYRASPAPNPDSIQPTLEEELRTAEGELKVDGCARQNSLPDRRLTLAHPAEAG
jgi:hypothetical protein